MASNTIASIVTWNHAHCVEACISSLLAQSRPLDQIIVWDNASSDGTCDVLAKFHGRLKVIQSQENKGFCGGHNPVIAQTSSDYVLLVNPDVVLRSDYVENAVKRMSQDEHIGTVCGLLTQSQREDADCRVDGSGLFVSRNRRFVLRGHGVPPKNHRSEPVEVFGADGALPLYRRKMIEHISIDCQFFDEMFFAHKEDHDISWRAQLCGWKTVFEPDCVAVHPRVFRPGNLQLRKHLPAEVRYHAVKNDLLILFKNEDLSNFFKDFFYIVPRRIGIFLYALLRERSSLKAYTFVFQNWRHILRARA